MPSKFLVASGKLMAKISTDHTRQPHYMEKGVPSPTENTNIALYFCCMTLVSTYGISCFYEVRFVEAEQDLPGVL